MNVTVQPNGEAVTAPKPDQPMAATEAAPRNPAVGFRTTGDRTEIRASRPRKDCELKSREPVWLERYRETSGRGVEPFKRPYRNRPQTSSLGSTQGSGLRASPAYREAIAEPLISQDYDVFVAENMVQGLGRMREERMDVIVLDASFDPLEQGVAFITREVRLLRPSERRRLFFVYVTSGVRTMDLHAAFLHNVNLVVNPSDIEQLPEALGVSIRHYNDLYRPFNRALDIAPI